MDQCLGRFLTEKEVNRISRTRPRKFYFYAPATNPNVVYSEATSRRRDSREGELSGSQDTTEISLSVLLHRSFAGSAKLPINLQKAELNLS